MRIFKVDRFLRVAIYTGMLANVVFYTTILGFAIRAIIHCVGAAWIESEFCEVVRNPIYISIFSFNVAMELYLLVLPIGRILKLQLSRKRRIGLLIVFASGLL